jgi:hypothetical protein
LHAECKLPINLRNFLAQQFGPALESDNESILDMAANADPATLSRVARAIRRYSTSRTRGVGGMRRGRGGFRAQGH